MQPLSLADILDNAEYAKIREEFRREIVRIKRPRRVAIGPHVAVTLENRDTMRFQIQEMMRIEGITTETAIQQELDVYNPLIPGSGELSFTLFIEVPEEHELKRVLPTLVGVEHALRLAIGDDVAAAIGEEGRSRDAYTSSVHYLRMALTPAQIKHLTDPQVPAALFFDHPRYGHREWLSTATREAMLEDLRG
jgi:hypothetical protein